MSENRHPIEDDEIVTVLDEALSMCDDHKDSEGLENVRRLVRQAMDARREDIKAKKLQ